MQKTLEILKAMYFSAFHMYAGDKLNGMSTNIVDVCGIYLFYQAHLGLVHLSLPLDALTA